MLKYLDSVLAELELPIIFNLYFNLFFERISFYFVRIQAYHSNKNPEALLFYDSVTINWH